MGKKFKKANSKTFQIIDTCTVSECKIQKLKKMDANTVLYSTYTVLYCTVCTVHMHVVQSYYSHTLIPSLHMSQSIKTDIKIQKLNTLKG